MGKDINYTEINSKIWDEWASSGGEWSQAINHEEFVKAEQGDFDIYLTPCKAVPHEWLIPMNGAKVLGLASGGGQQCPVFAAQKANVTVFDYSDKQLELEKTVSEREGILVADVYKLDAYTFEESSEVELNVADKQTFTIDVKEE